MSTQDGTPKSSELSKTSITIYGGKKDDVGNDAKSILGIAEDDYYGTWLSMGIMRRLGFLTEGGVESAGGLGEIVCVFAIIIAVLAMFAFWNVVVVFIAVIVLTLLSGGAAYKFIRAVYITAPISNMETSKIEEFVSKQLTKGRFVKIESETEMSAIARSSSKASTAFQRGIQFALFIATIFLITEVIYFLMNQHWLSGLNVATADFEIMVLIVFGVLFLIGVIVMDIGVLLKRNAAKRIE
ncbi:hypothetical protein E4H12_09765 [Candidatus Thorarchaeota archaeon]|nr:MAG: hypothetical protein E4H12_09765 [Candidatus Thorarchaeota archaeon]